MHENREVFGRYGIFDSDWHRTEGSGSAGTKVPCAAKIRRILCMPKS